MVTVRSDWLQQTLRVWAGAVLVLAVACGRAGSSSSGDAAAKSAAGAVIDYQLFGDYKGLVTTQGGMQGALRGWYLVAIDHASQLGHLATLNAVGGYSLNHLFQTLDYTLVLLSPSMVLRAVLAHPTEDPSQFEQGFGVVLDQAELPRLTVSGSTMQWDHTDTIRLTGHLTRDSDADGVPDGVGEALGGSAALLLNDIDGDGRGTEQDSDLDGDGLINVVDLDDDGDSTVDAPADDGFDLDQDGDTIVDIGQPVSGLTYPRNIEYAAVRVDYQVPASGTDLEQRLYFTLKLAESNPEPVREVRVIKTDLITPLVGAQAQVADAAGATSLQAWNGSLTDDGLNEDGAAADRTYARYVTLARGAELVPYQVFAFEVLFESGWSLVALHTHGRVTPRAFTPTYDAATRTVNLRGKLQGEVFADQLNTKWVVRVFTTPDSGGQVEHYTSDRLPSSATTFVLPEQALPSGGAPTLRVSAEGATSYRGIPSYTLTSAAIPL